jgi:hypothetical protein
VSDRVVITAIAAGDLTFDSLVRTYIRTDLGFRFIGTTDGTETLQVEREIQPGPEPFGPPLPNPFD